MISPLLSSAEPATVVVSVASLLGGKPHYVHFGGLSISVANLVVIVLMIVVFALAVVAPFPKDHDKP